MIVEMLSLTCIFLRNPKSTFSNFRSSLTTKLPYLDLKTYVMDLFKGNRNRIKNSKAKDMTFNIHILLMLVTQIKQAINKPMVPIRNNNIIIKPI